MRAAGWPGTMGFEGKSGGDVSYAWQLCRLACTRGVRECRPSAHFQRADPAVAREAEAVGQIRRTAVERARHLHDNDRPIALDPAFERLRRDAILFAGLLLPGTDRVCANDVAALVPHHGVRCEAGDHRTDVVIILRLEIAGKDLRQVGFHARLPHLLLLRQTSCAAILRRWQE